jgi:hypothetical protein
MGHGDMRVIGCVPRRAAGADQPLRCGIAAAVSCHPQSARAAPARFPLRHTPATTSTHTHTHTHTHACTHTRTYAQKHRVQGRTAFLRGSMTMFLARAANLSVLRLSSRDRSDGDTVHTTATRACPASDDCSMRVSFESRYGTWPLGTQPPPVSSCKQGCTGLGRQMEYEAQKRCAYDGCGRG